MKLRTAAIALWIFLAPLVRAAPSRRRPGRRAAGPSTTWPPTMPTMRSCPPSAPALDMLGKGDAAAPSGRRLSARAFQTEFRGRRQQPDPLAEPALLRRRFGVRRARVSQAVGRGVRQAGDGRRGDPRDLVAARRGASGGESSRWDPALGRIEGPKAADAIKHLLNPPHPNVAVLVGAIAEAGKRHLKELAPDLLPLCGHYRRSVREAARKVADQMHLAPIPDYHPEDAFTPSLARQLKDIASMVLPEIPPQAQWDVVTVRVPAMAGNEERSYTVTGWLSGEKGDECQAVDWFGRSLSLPKKECTIKPATFAETAKKFHEIRNAQGDDAGEKLGELSRRGMLTGQFEPRFVSQPELLTAAWAYARGDKKAAAAVLFERIDDMADDRWLIEVARDLVGNMYHQEMLREFSDERDYAATLRLARHLSKPVFDGFQYQRRAKNLAAQLERRTDDFKTFRLPAPDEWKALQAKLSRAEQIKYLAERLRLLNCHQWGQPGGVSYRDEQFASAQQSKEKPAAVINPFNELTAMKLAVADLPPLVPYLADEDYMLVYSYWRDFHPGRDLHQVNFAVAEIVNATAKRDLADLGAFNRLDEAGRKAHLGKILDWCRANAGKSAADLSLQTLRNTKDWSEFSEAAEELVRVKNALALVVLIDRAGDFKGREGDIAELCYAFDSAEAVAAAREWIKGKDEDARFWSALILIRHGDKAKSEGLDPLKALLAEDDGTRFFPSAIDDLLAMKNEAAAALACSILKKPRFGSEFDRGEILLRLFLAGRQEALDYLFATLKSTESGGSASGTYKGKRVARQLTAGDELAGQVAQWRTDKWEFDTLAEPDERRQQRDDLTRWLKEQFALIKAGKPPAMRTDVAPVHRALASQRSLTGGHWISTARSGVDRIAWPMILDRERANQGDRAGTGGRCGRWLRRHPATRRSRHRASHRPAAPMLAKSHAAGSGTAGANAKKPGPRKPVAKTD